MTKISVVTACYNEEENVEELCAAVRKEFQNLPQYEYEHLFIDNCSRDLTVRKLKEIAAKDKHVKIIVNVRNFGHIRSPYHALLQAQGDAVISLVADFQDPPELIPELLARWESGSAIVVGMKKKSRENFVVFQLRRLYYKVLASISDVEQIQNFTGFGLYDKKFLDALRGLNEPYPYFRGLVAELGFGVSRLEYIQPARKHGKSKNNFFTLYDMAMLGFVNHSKVPLRLASFIGGFVAFVSLFVAVVYLIMKLTNWESFQIGSAPLIIGLFFFSSVQLLFIGIIGEYIGAIYTQVKSRPHVIEKERINFD